jgi:hypothetical protein
VTAKKPAAVPKKVDAPSPLIPYRWKIHEAKAIQQVCKGKASPEEQVLAMKVIVEGICGTYDEPYRPGVDDQGRDTAFACGKANVGRQIVKLSKLNLDLFTKKETEPDDEPQS